MHARFTPRGLEWGPNENSLGTLSRFCVLVGAVGVRKYVGISARYWSERRDLNSGPPVPQTGALTGLRYAPPLLGGDDLRRGGGSCKGFRAASRRVAAAGYGLG